MDINLGEPLSCHKVVPNFKFMNISRLIFDLKLYFQLGQNLTGTFQL